VETPSDLDSCSKTVTFSAAAVARATWSDRLAFSVVEREIGRESA